MAWNMHRVCPNAMTYSVWYPRAVLNSCNRSVLPDISKRSEYQVYAFYKQCSTLYPSYFVSHLWGKGMLQDVPARSGQRKKVERPPILFEQSGIWNLWEDQCRLETFRIPIKSLCNSTTSIWTPSSRSCIVNCAPVMRLYRTSSMDPSS